MEVCFFLYFINLCHFTPWNDLWMSNMKENICIVLRFHNLKKIVLCNPTMTLTVELSGRSSHPSKTRKVFIICISIIRGYSKYTFYWMIIIILLYIIKFYIVCDEKISSNSEMWPQRAEKQLSKVRMVEGFGGLVSILSIRFCLFG